MTADENWTTVGQKRRGEMCVHKKKRTTKSQGPKVGTLNVGTMTGKDRELVDIMQKTYYIQETYCV